MRRLAVALVGLYPRPWRDRYGAELLALLEQLDPRPGDLLGLLAGALAAHATLLKETHSMKTVSRLAVLALIAGALVIVVVLSLSGVISEGPQEFLLLLAPLLVLPAIAPLAMTYPTDRPQLNGAVRWLGFIAVAGAALPALLSVVLSMLQPGPNSPIPWLSAIFLAALVGLAIWFMLNGWLGLRGGVMTAPLALLGILFGLLSLLVFVTVNGTVQAALPRETYTGLMSLVTPLWLLCGVVWMGWTAGWLWRVGANLTPARP